jgi:hypothetical protein
LPDRSNTWLKYPQVKYAKPGVEGYSFVDGYDQLIKVKNSNLGWRILAEFFLEKKEFISVLEGSMDGTPMKRLLKEEFISLHREVLNTIRNGLIEGQITKDMLQKFKKLLGCEVKDITERFFPPEEQKLEINKNALSILLTSFKGCKGLSAGHVFIVGANNGSIPRDPSDIKDVEISQFIVALTRTRKQCHIISNKWLYSPKDKNGNWNTQYQRTKFMESIPRALVDDLGYCKAAEIQ